MALTILSLRGFARVKAEYDRKGDKADAPARTLALVKEIDFAIAQADIDRERAAEA